jgi:serine phosphatase RsbU (regulator of sigma subunit)
MYFGNARGVLTFDGVNWEVITVKNNSVVRSLAIDSSGTIYVGAVGEFGYLKSNKKGGLEYQSLLNQLPESEKEFADVWKTYATPEGIYFQTFSKIFRLKNNSFKIWKPGASFHLSFYINKKLFVVEREVGLLQLNEDKLELVKNGEIFSSNRIYGMFPFSKKSILIACREKGLLVFNENDHNTFKPLENKSNEELIEAQIYSGVKIHQNNYCLATLKKGVFLIDEKGEITLALNKKNGLLDDNVKYVALDNQHDLWMAFGNGISRAEISSPLRLYDDAQGLNGSVEEIIYFKQQLYAATSTGVYVLKKGFFIPVQNITSAAWSMEIATQNNDSVLLVATESGIYSIKNDAGEFIKEGFAYTLLQSKKNPNCVFIGMNDGLTSMQYLNNKWMDGNYIEGIDADIRAIAEDEDGNLWLGSSIQGIFLVGQPDAKNKNKVSQVNKNANPVNYDTTAGLPDLKNNIPILFNHKMLFATTNGLYEFDSSKEKFYPSSILKQELSGRQVFKIAAINNTLNLFTVISNLNFEMGIASFKNGKYSWYTKPFLRISEMEIHSILPLQNNCLWLGGPEGIIKYNAEVIKDYNQPFQSLIRIVKANNKDIFSGNYSSGDSTKFEVQQNKEFIPILDFKDNSLQFEYTATSYSNSKKNLFNIYLEGYDKDWSGWSTKIDKEFTNLKEGNYVFHVKAKNIYGKISTESTFAFKVLPPWYRHWIAYFVYVVLFFSVLFGFNSIRTRQLQQRQIKLQEKIEEATAEIKEQKHLIEEKHKEITDSINYAERIQRSFLATKQHFDFNLNQSAFLNSITTVISSAPNTVTSSEVEKLTASGLDSARPDNSNSTHTVKNRVTSSEVEKSTASGLDSDQPDNYFILFKPKDVVSGDFYWSATLNNGLFALATADSTGHGVPGAIMSLLNITSLEKAIETHNEPNEILNATRKIIIDRLKKDGSEDGGKDGMDCSLCVYDFKNMQLHIAAANNPVWIVRQKKAVTSSEVEKSTENKGLDSARPDNSNSTHAIKNSVTSSEVEKSTENKGLDSARPVNEVIEIKPDKMPVGKHDKQDIPFSLQTVELCKGDVVYTLTDGFPDQFGGEKGKKFMSKNLRELLTNHAHLPMAEQKQLLETTFLNWVGDLEQIDDVTIIGVKVI